jgi:hypothetical protein
VTTPNETVHESPAPRAEGGSPRTAAALSLSALVLFIVLAMQSVHPIVPTARAEMTVKDGSYSAMTTRAGPEEVLWVLDDRAEALMIYSVATNNSEVVLKDRQNLKELFANAKAQAGG